MKTQRFAVVLDKTPSDDDTNLMYEAGLEDCTIEISNHGPSVIWVDRKAKTFDDALTSVTTQLATCGFRAVEVRHPKPTKVGRPSFTKAGTRSPQVTFVTPDFRYQQLAKVAAIKGVKKSDIARWALDEYLDRELSHA